MTNFARYLNIRATTAPVISPDGRRVAFLSDITGNDQVWSVGTDAKPGEWPRQLTFLSDKVWEVHGNSANEHLIAVGDVGGNELQQFYLITGYGSADGHDVRRLTTDDAAIHRFGAWSRDGQRILYASNARNGVDFDLYQMQVDGGTPEFLCEMLGNRSVMAWSPNESQVLVGEDVGPLQTELYGIDVATGNEDHLTAEQSPAVYHAATWTKRGVYLLSDRPHDGGAICHLDVATGKLKALATAEAHSENGEFELLTIDHQSTHAAYTYNAEGYSQLWVLTLNSNSRRRIEGLPQGQISHITFSGTTLVCDLMTPTTPSDIWAIDVQEGTLRRLTHSDLAGIAQRSFVAPQLITYPSFDDRLIPAFYYLPTTPPPPGGYPCILYVHGGPTSQLRPDFDVRFQYFLSRGYAILGTNVRGSTGYGREYAALDELEKRPDSVTDLKYAVRWLQTQDAINESRIAIYGRSYGGYMVLAALTEFPELFAAGINTVGIANWVSFMERTSAWRRHHRAQEYGSLEHHRDLLEQLSPIHKAERITVPLMVIAGDNDPRVPLFESEQIVERVRAAGGTVKFLHYADEGHKISKLENRIDSFTQMAEFLERYL